MQLRNNMKLSNTMLETINIMENHNGKLIRYRGGWWSWENSEIKYYMRKEPRETPHFTDYKIHDDDYAIPIWNCDVKTVRALQKRGLVVLDEMNSICTLKEQ